MSFFENIFESLRSIKGNLLRTVLTTLIIAIGITALVGILTSVDGIQASVDTSISDLGGKSFQINKKGENTKRRRRGVVESPYEEIKYSQVTRFKRLMGNKAQIAASVLVSWNAEAKHDSKKTNPNSAVWGCDENFLLSRAYTLKEGRNFSPTELSFGADVAIIGPEVKEKLFENSSPIGKDILVLGRKFKVIGLIEKKGGMMNGRSSDRYVMIPIANASQLATNFTLNYTITGMVQNPVEFDQIMGEATGYMRSIRGDKPGKPDSFEISRNESLKESMDGVTKNLTAAGLGIGLITLLGAAIGLMNIMLVTVTERTREIGIRKALGATPSQIRYQFLIEAIVICQIGGLAGMVLGIGIGNIVASFMEVSKFIIPWGWMLFTFFVCIVVGVLSGWYPAFKASKLDPIEALRFE